MPFEQLAISLVESGCNQLNRMDNHGRARRERLDGKVIALNLREWKPVYFLFSRQQLDLLGEFNGSADATLSLSIGALGLLRNPSNLAHYIRQGKMDLEGDLQILQKFAELFTEARIDWEEQLSEIVGDVAAHTLCRLGQKLHQDTRRLSKTLLDTSGEYVTQELKLAPGSLELACFYDEVELLQQQLERLELRTTSLARELGVL
ncbi:ubiquinone biosynthesis accessory factor UbiJ [Dongshaea marina]|uniref:ubiquinone biosynthesis accessory factor UbiJ n=1 Tax=Dongshaea marina TaxID=2047966 RepID=UPI000D3E5CCD|nr:SCP2 sterol-binding domain-containing protein [Dongshaea marina]